MATIPIWNGAVTVPISGSTPFGLYDNDPQFQSDGPRFAVFASQRLGYPITDIEMQDINFYTCLEEAISEYGAQVHQWKIRENYLNLEGSSAEVSLTGKVINPNLGTVITISKGYGVEGLSGGNIPYYTGSIDIATNQQWYDLNAWASSSIPHLSGSKIEIKQIYHKEPPAIVRYFDPYAGTGTGIQSLMEAFGFGQYSPGVNFMLMPISYDVTKLQAIEFNDMIRRSNFSFEVHNNQLKIFPVPRYNTVLWFDYIIESERRDPLSQYVSGSNLVSDYSNVPYSPVSYVTVNSVGRQWIFKYALALAKELLANIRGKYSTIPIPDSEVTLNADVLRSEAQNEKDSLIQQLQATLDEITRRKQLENQQAESNNIKDILTNVPTFIYIG
jgi:hypothetical protein